MLNWVVKNRLTTSERVAANLENVIPIIECSLSGALLTGQRNTLSLDEVLSDNTTQVLIGLVAHRKFRARKDNPVVSCWTFVGLYQLKGPELDDYLA